MSRSLHLYLFVIFCLSVVMGVQIVAVPWLAMDYLKLSATAVGVVQAAVLIPNALLLILGGIHADRGNLWRKFLFLLVIYGLIQGFLLLVMAQDVLVYTSLLIYALMLGCVAAFIQPCKDFLMGSLAQDRLQSFIAKNSLCQSFGQALGFMLASTLYSIQVITLPLVQILFLVIAFIALVILVKRNDSGLDSLKKDLSEQASTHLLFSGFIQCWRSKTLRSLIFIVAVNGFFHIGVFIVALPLLARDIYLGGIGFFSWLQCLFVLGSALITIVVIVRGHLNEPGRRVIFGLLYGGLILLGLSLGPTQYGMMMLIVLWGVVVGVNAILGRAILQSQAEADYRGRIISVYQLALFGCAPLGSLFAGFAIDQWGVLYVFKLCAIASFIAFGVLFLTRSLWALEADDTASSP